uniref:Uncharacterized protein n=1 Tax=Lepeophtheirus salmonis TaxID=72036 RepID=A0A0K2TJR9_LEPSM
MFKMHRTSFGKVFRTWLNFIYYQFKEIDLFLPNPIIDLYILEDFKSKFSNTIMILDLINFKSKI